MKLIIQRANQDFGPYPLALVEQYIAQGSLLPHDLARKEGESVSASLPLGKLLAQCGGANPLAGNPFQTALQNLKSFDPRLLFPWGTIRSFSWLKDRRLIYLASVGLAPAIALTLAPGIWAGYWAVALYFSVRWALFFLLPLPHTAGDAKTLFSVLRLYGHRFDFIADDDASDLALECVDGDGAIDVVPAALVRNVPRRGSE